MAGMDQNRMIRSKELHVMLREVVADGGGGAMLISCKGAILASAGFDQAEPKIVSAIAAHVWAHVALVPTKYPQVGALRTMARRPRRRPPPPLFRNARAPPQLFDVEGGTLVLGELLEASHFARGPRPRAQPPRRRRATGRAAQVCLYSKKEYGEPLSDLFGASAPTDRPRADAARPSAARLAALQQKLAEMCGDALSGRPDDSPEAGAAALDADAAAR